MTVGEMIEELSKYPKDYEFCVVDQNYQHLLFLMDYSDAFKNVVCRAIEINKDLMRT